MKKKAFLLLIIFLFAIGFAFGEDGDTVGGLSIEELKKMVTVVTDCLSSSFVSSCSEPQINLPSTTVSIDTGTLLPLKISFFIADPYNFANSMAKSMGGLNSLFSMVNKAVSNPLLPFVYFTLSSRNYEVNDYLVNGSVVFSYSEGTTQKSLYNALMDKRLFKEEVVLNTDISIYGKKVTEAVSFIGSLKIYVDSENKIVIEPSESFKVNGQSITGLKFFM